MHGQSTSYTGDWVDHPVFYFRAFGNLTRVEDTHPRVRAPFAVAGQPVRVRDTISQPRLAVLVELNREVLEAHVSSCMTVSRTGTSCRTCESTLRRPWVGSGGEPNRSVRPPTIEG